jgi:signal transduction histidine kinase
MLTAKFLVFREHPSQAQLRITSGVALTLFLAFVVTLFFLRQPLPRIEAFLPVVNTTLVVGYLSTATLLFAQARALRFRPLYLLGAGYFFNGLMTISRCRTFPGTFAAQGLLGARADTSLWLGNAGLAGFSIAILAYARTSQRTSPQPSAQSPPHSALGLYLIVTVAAALLLTLLATAGAPLLPLLTASQMRWGPALYIVESLVLLLTAAAMVALLLGRRPVLDLWLLIVLWSLFLEALLVLLSSGRFTAGWYVGQAMGMLSSVFVLFALLAETNSLYGQTMDQLMAERLERENRFLIRDAIAASIAHELRQPLSVILLDTRVARRKPAGQGEEMAELLDEITAAGRRANDIIASTRAMFRHEAVEKQSMDLEALLRSTLALVRSNARARHVSTDLVVEEQLRPVRGNRLQMQQALQNLFQNAIEALSRIEGRRRTLTVRCMPSPKDGVTIRVEDNGPGIALADREMIFDPYFTTRREGTGLGLAITRQVVETHGGQIGVEPLLPFGTAFVIQLPYENDEAT